MTDLSRYPPGTILSQMVIDIYANKTQGEVTILHDRPFEKPLKSLALDRDGGLEFVYADGARRALGVPLKADIAALMRKTVQVQVFQMDMKTKQPVAGMTVPLAVKD